MGGADAHAFRATRYLSTRNRKGRKNAECSVRPVRPGILSPNTKLEVEARGYSIKYKFATAMAGEPEGMAVSHKT